MNREQSEKATYRVGAFMIASGILVLAIGFANQDGLVIIAGMSLVGPAGYEVVREYWGETTNREADTTPDNDNQR